MIKKLEETTFAASLDKFASGLVSYFDDGGVLALSLVHQLRLAAKNAETLAEDQSPWLKGIIICRGSALLSVPITRQL